MNKFDGRHVCMSDLIRYLKRDEYLSGYTESEQEQIRKNIGALGISEINDIVSQITNLYILDSYKNIKTLVETKQLKIGYTYAISDFSSMYISNANELITSSVNYVVILTATDSNKFNSRVTLLSTDYLDSYKWIVEFDFNSELLKDNTYTKGKITYLKDCNNNIAYYDFKGIQFRRTKEELSKLGINIKEPYKYLFTFNDSNLQEASNGINVKNNHFDSDCTNNIFIGNNCINNIFKGGFKNNTFTGPCENNYFGFDSQNNNFKDAVYYVTGTINNKDFIDLNYTTNLISKQFVKTEEGYAISYVDSDTLTYQTILL